jgi:hypothetical protein
VPLPLRSWPYEHPTESLLEVLKACSTDPAVAVVGRVASKLGVGVVRQNVVREVGIGLP